MAEDLVRSVSETLSKEKERLKKNRRGLYSEIGKDLFVNRLLLRLGTKRGGNKGPTSGEVERVVSRYLNEIDEMSDGAFKATPKATGSRSENANMSENDDFDFLVVLDKFDAEAMKGSFRGILKHDDLPCFDTGKLPLEAQVEAPKHFKTSELDQNSPKHISFFELYSPTSGGKRLNASAFILIFQNWLKRVIPRESVIQANGPATTVWVKVGAMRVKIDLTLAIKIEKRKDINLRPLKQDDRNDQNKKALRNGAVAALDNCFKNRDSFGELKKPEMKIYYVIATGDVWRLSAANQERYYLENNMDQASKTVYKALKWINTEFSITDTSEDPIMSSYPMKISIIKQERQGGVVTKTKRPYSETCQKILSNIDESTDRLESVFIKSDAVYRPGQKSYLEARRIALYIRSIRRVYAGHGIIQTILLMGIFIPNFINSFLYGSLILRQNGYLSTRENFTLPMSEFARDVVLFGLQPLSIVSVAACAMGIVSSVIICYCITSRYCTIYKMDFGEKEPQMTLVYRLHRWVMLYYTLFLVVGMVPVVHYSLWMECFDLWPRRKPVSGPPIITSSNHFCISHHHVTGEYPSHTLHLRRLGMASIAITLLTCLTIFIHFCVVMIITKCRANRNKYGWVFFGLTCCCDFPCQYRCSCKNPEEDPEDQGSSVVAVASNVAFRVDSNEASPVHAPGASARPDPKPKPRYAKRDETNARIPEEIGADDTEEVDDNDYDVPPTPRRVEEQNQI